MIPRRWKTCAFSQSNLGVGRSEFPKTLEDIGKYIWCLGADLPPELADDIYQHSLIRRMTSLCASLGAWMKANGFNM